jgi:tetratricopeptide (TPR) repeat protein
MKSFKLSTAILWTTAILLSLAPPGCGKSGQDLAKKHPEPVESTAAKTGQMPTEQECREFAARFERAVLEGDIVAFNVAFDYDAMLESATGGIPGVEAYRKPFIQGAKGTITGKTSFGAVLIQQVAAGGSFVFLRTIEKDNQKRALFRLLLPDGGMNYHEWILVREPTGRVKAIDCYVYLSAELISRAVRRPFLSLVASQSRSVLSKLTSGENEYVKNIQAIGKMVEANNSGNHSQVQSIYDGFPQSLKKEKNILLMRLMAASASGDDIRHLEAIEDFRKFHPNDPCVTIISIDHHLMNKNYHKALNCIKQIDEAVGGDPHLLFLQGNVHYIKGDLQTARRLLREAIQAEPTLQAPYWSLVEISLDEKDFDETNRLLEQLEQKFQIEFFNFTEIPAYAEYVKSPQYQQWLKKHPPMQAK